MTSLRPIDAVPWGSDDPQDDELGVVPMTMDINMAGMAFTKAYSFHFCRSVLATFLAFERQWLHFIKLSWLHEAPGKTQLLIKIQRVLPGFPCSWVTFQRHGSCSCAGTRSILSLPLGR